MRHNWQNMLYYIYTLSGRARQPKACITGCSNEYTTLCGIL